MLSTKAADTRGTASASELLSGSFTKGERLPDGFRRFTTVVTGGYGSFSLAVPRSWTMWNAGTPADQLLAYAQARDPEWTRVFRPALTSPDSAKGSLRAVLLDPERPDAVVATRVTLSDDDGLRGDRLAQEQARINTAQGSQVRVAREVTVNGAKGAYLESVISERLVGGPERRVEMQVLLPDEPNRKIWGLSCDVPASLADQVRPVCAQLAASFQPLPRVRQ